MKKNNTVKQKPAIAHKTVLNEVGGAVMLKDILKDGAKLVARKLTKKEIKKLNEEISKIKFEYTKQRPFTWEELHTPMDI